jgi:hypothetical protein
MFIVIDWDYHCLVITDLTAILDKKTGLKKDRIVLKNLQAVKCV